MPWIIAGGAVLGAGIGASASSSASKAQSKSASEAIKSQEKMFNKQIELQEPFRQVGVNALPELVEASKYTPFTMEQFQADPGYAFRLQEGLKALDRSAAARGGLLSGATLKGAQRYGQDLGSQEYTNAFNRYQLERQARLNPLQSLAGMSQTAANTMSNQAGQFGESMAQNAMAQGNIRASGYMNTANALTGGLNQYLNYQQNQQMMDRFFPKPPPQTTSPTFTGMQGNTSSSSEYGSTNPFGTYKF
jgi:hypothetical protein